MSVSAGQVEIAVKVDGAESAVNNFKQLENQANKLDGRKIKITADASIRDINRQLGEIERKRFEYKVSFSKALDQAKRYTQQIDALDKPMAHLENRATKFGYSIKRGLTRDFDVLTKNGEELGFVSNKLVNTQNRWNKSLKAGSNVFRGRVRGLNDINWAANKYNGLLTKQVDLEAKRSALNVNWDQYYAKLGKFSTEIEGLKAARDSYQALDKEADVTNKLAKSMPPVVQRFKDFQGQLQNMDRGSALTSVNDKMSDLRNTISLIQSKRAELGLNTGSEEENYAHSIASSQLGEYERLYQSQLRFLTAQQKDLLKYDEMQKKIETDVVRWGSRMQSLGNGIQRVTSPFMNVFRGIAMGAGYRALNSAMQGINNAFSRYDTMKTYGIVLEELGMNATKKFAVGTGDAMNAVDNLNAAVLGLPTGLDEVVAAMRVYAGATGDVEKATKLAIAANNTFIAGGMDDRQKLYTQRQLLALAGGEELESQSWSSLRRNAPLAFRAVAEKMKVSVKDLAKGLKDGSIEGQKFLDVFIKVGTEGKINSAAQKMKQTWSAVSQNVQNAFARMGEGVLKTLDSVFERQDGRTFLQHVLGVDKNGKFIGGGIRGFIDDMSEDFQKWIKANPDAITNFFEKFASIDWKGMISGFAQFGQEFSGFMLSIGRVLGNADVMKWMLRFNLIGKAISIFGSMGRGLAGPISKAIMHGGIIKYITSAFKSIIAMLPFAKKASESGKHIVKGAHVMSAAAKSMLTWQDVVSKGLNIGSILVVAKSVEIMSRAMQTFSSVKWDANMIGNLGTASLFLGGMTKFLTSLGTTVAAAMSTTGGKLVIGGSAIVETMFLGIGKTMEMIGKGVSGLGDGIRAVGTIATMEMPTPEQVATVGKTINEIAKAFNDNKNPFENLGSAISAWSKGLQAGNIKKISDALDSIQHLSEVELSRDQLKKAKKNFNNIQQFTVDLMALFDDEENEQMEKSVSTPHEAGMNGKYKGGYTFAGYKDKVRDFADTISSMSTVFTDLSSIVNGMKVLNKQFANINKLKAGGVEPFDYDVLYYRIKNLADNIYRFASNDEESPFWKLQQAASQLKGGNYSKISELFTEVPNMIDGLETIYKKLTESSLFEEQGLKIQEAGHKSPLDALSDKLEPVFTAITSINNNIPAIGGLKRLRGIQRAVGRIPEIINEIVGVMNNTKVGSINTESIRGVVRKITEALSEFESLSDKSINVNVNLDGTITDNVSSKIEDAKKKIDEAKDSIKNIKKKISVSISADMHNSAVSAINSARVRIMRAFNSIPSSLTKTVNIDINKVYDPGNALNDYGVLDQHNGGKVLYRAGGGSIFVPRGTDTVPAMLTPGEFVIRRSSAQSLGYGLLNRLNHMDIKGALNSLSMRAAQGISSSTSSVVNNTTNNKNIGGLTLNNYNSPSVGRARASSWVKSL